MDTSRLIISTRSLLSGIVLSSLFALAACGSGGQNAVNNPPPTLVSIQVSAPNANLIVGQSEQLTATGKYSDKTTKDVTASVAWTTSPAGLATVAANGTLTAQASGTVSITASMNSVSGSVSLTIAPKLVSMTIAPTSATIASSTKQQFIATGTFSDNSVQTITGSVSWSSSKPAVATISDTSPTKGLALGVSAGTTTITATSGNVSATASLIVTSASATSLAITPNPASMALFVSQQFTATAQFSDGTSQDVTNVATWSSSSTPTASVTASGVVSAKKVTTTAVTISATFESQSASSPLTINSDNLTSISISPQGGIAPGTKVQFTATGTFNDGSTHNLTTQVTWTSSDTTVLNFVSGSTAKGLVTGTVTVTATLGSVVGSESFNVSNATIQSVTVTPANSTIPIGGHLTLTATGLFSDSTTQDITTSVSWGVSDTTVASVGNTSSNIGVVNGLKAGTTNVTATFGGTTGMTGLTVSSAILQSIAVTPTSSLVVPASTEQLNATGKFTDGSTQVLNQYVTWSETDTSGSNVATVGPAGIVTGNSAGTATVTAKSGSLSGSASLAVEGSPLKSIQVSSQTASVPETIQLPFTAMGLFGDGQKLDLTSVVSWTSSAPSVATISNAPNSDGVATGVSMGTTTIGASFQSQSASANLTVTNATLVSIAVTPANPSISLGSTQQFTATGSFNLGPDINITNQVAWSSTDPAVAVIKTSGVAVSAATGTTTIKASLNGVSGPTVLTVH